MKISLPKHLILNWFFQSFEIMSNGFFYVNRPVFMHIMHVNHCFPSIIFHHGSRYVHLRANVKNVKLPTK